MVLAVSFMWIATSMCIFRKATHTGRFLHYRSHCQSRTKTGIISCLRKRGRGYNICLEEEIRNRVIVRFEDVFSANGYPVSRVQAVLQTTESLKEKKNDEESWISVLPYFQGLSECFTKSCQKVNIHTAFKLQTTLSNTLTCVKGKLPPEKQYLPPIYINDFNLSGSWAIFISE